jgi:hypothetical protein
VDVRKQSASQGRLGAIWVVLGGITISFVTTIVAIVQQPSNTAALAAVGIILLGFAIAVVGLVTIFLDWWLANRAQRVRAADLVSTDRSRRVPSDLVTAALPLMGVALVSEGTFDGQYLATREKRKQAKAGTLAAVQAERKAAKLEALTVH